MKNLILCLLFITTAVATAQIKGKSSKEPYTSSNGKVYEKKDVITLKEPSGEDAFVYAYTYKSSMSLGNIRKTLNTARDVKNMNLKNTQGLTNAVRTAKNLSSDEILKTSVRSMQSKAVSEKYREENKLDSSSNGNTYKIRSFKIYTDEETGEQIVHAIAKGKGGKVAILIDAAEEAGEIE
ncbi:MAG: hypothetical protein WBG46_09050 [Nonlabens sp.]